MIGFIVVDDTENFQSIQKDVQDQSKRIYANKERIKGYLDQIKSSSWWSKTYLSFRDLSGL